MIELQLPAGYCRPATRQECLDNAKRYREYYDNCVIPSMRKYLKGEIRGWLRLAEDGRK